MRTGGPGGCDRPNDMQTRELAGDLPDQAET